MRRVLLFVAGMDVFVAFIPPFDFASWFCLVSAVFCLFIAFYGLRGQ